MHVAANPLHHWIQPATASTAARIGVLAEIGVNHDGDPKRAASLIDAAAAAGADGVKFQLFHPTRLLSRDALLAGYQAGAATDAVDLLAKLTLPLHHLRSLREHARQRGLRFVVTPFSLGDVADLATLDVDAVKIASPDAVNTPLLTAAAKLGCPLLISTGTCELAELTAAAEHASRTGGALLQCVSAYPTADADAALAGIGILQRWWQAHSAPASPHPQSTNGFAPAACPVGYSDHTTAEDTGALAVAAGALLLEKHLTHDRSAPGPDHAASLETDALARYIAAARRAAHMLGPLTKTCLRVEADVRKVSRQSWVTTADLPAGHVLRPQDLCLKRPGTGLPAASPILGRRLAHPIAADRVLHDSDLDT